MTEKQQNIYYIFLSIVIAIFIFSTFFYHKSKYNSNLKEINKYGKYTIGKLIERTSSGGRFNDNIIVKYFVDSLYFEIHQGIEQEVKNSQFFIVKYSEKNHGIGIVLENLFVPKEFQKFPSVSWDSIEFNKIFVSEDL